jgi:HD-like signal output (HDOD) protein/FixJ family two-component response regulator
MKILVVDDELVSRKKMQMIMESIGVCETAECGTDAVGTFRRSCDACDPFDLITLDILMPDMDGTKVLSLIREIEEEQKIPKDKRAKIFMVTSQSEKDTIIACVQSGCDDFIIKPFTRETVTKKLINSGFKAAGSTEEGIKAAQSGRDFGEPEGKSAFIETIINRFKRGEIDLPSMPQIHMKFKQLVDSGATLQNIAELLKQDAAISSKLISISNSAYYRGMVENKNLESAISRLGIETTKQTVNAIANRGMYATSNKKYVQIVENLWMHSLSCAYASQATAKIIQAKLDEDAFTLGLLHDIGKLVLVKVVAEAEKRSQEADESEVMELLQALDAYHGRTGSILLKKWGFSEKYISVSMNHDAIENAGGVTKELEVVHFSNLLVKNMGYGRDEPTDTVLEDIASARLLGLDAAMIAGIKEKVREQMDTMKQLLE